MKKLLIALLMTSLPLLAAATGSIKGTVTDSKTGKPIKGVSVRVAETGQSSITNARGNFHIKKVKPGQYTLKVTHKAFKPQTHKKVIVKNGKATILNLKLQFLTRKYDGKSTAQYRINELMKNDKKEGEQGKDSKTPESKDDSEGSEEEPDLSNDLKMTFYQLLKSDKKMEAKDKVKTEDTPSTLSKPSGPEASDESVESLEDEEVTVTDDLHIPESSPSPSAPAMKFLRDEGGLPEEEAESEPDDDIEIITTEKHKYVKPGKDKLGLSRSMSVKPEKTKPPKKRPRPKSSGLKAGYADDNQQFNYFLNFLNKYKSEVASYSYDISERIHLILSDSEGKSLPNVDIKIYDQRGRHILQQGKTYSDGSFFFYPAETTLKDKTFSMTYTVDDVEKTMEIQRDGPRNIEIKSGQPRQTSSAVPVDIIFILDTTGSMGEEIKRLIETIDMIHMNLSVLTNAPLIRFGMVLYRDRDDKYRTKVVPLTADIEKFSKALEKVKAGGGGDTPEDLQSALDKSLHDLDWNENGLRMGFVITDAHPHLDYRQKFTYISAALEAKRQGIKLFSVGTGGLGIRGEYVLRQISQLTYAKYLFLTYGNETGENKGGVAGSVSHHTGSNYQTDRLEAIIMRLAKEEIANFTDEPLEQGEDYFEAEKVDFETREETLAKLFKDAVSRLIDYSTLRIDNSRKLGVLPIHTNTVKAELSAEYFTEQVQLSVAENKQFVLIARKDLQAVLEEQKLQLSGLLSEDETTRIGELLNAELLLSGELYKKTGGYDLFLKLLRVETAEILAVTKIVIDEDLGL